MKRSLFLFLLLFCIQQTYAQHIAVTFQNAVKNGIQIEHLDSLYKSAVHADTAKAVFKTQAEQQRLQKAYQALIFDLGDYLAKNNFKWNKKVRCFNRIYFKENGTIDYFLYNFLPAADDPSPLPKAQRKEFNKLLSQFITNYQFQLSAPVKFAQCSPVSYSDR